MQVTAETDRGGAPGGIALWNFEGQTAVVTEAASARGLAQVEALARAGARVYACDRAQEVAIDGAKGVVPVIVDLTEETRVAALAGRVVAEAEGLDVLIVNHVTREERSLLDLPDDEWRELTRGALSSAFLVAKCLPPIMTGAGSGKVVFTTGPESGAVGEGHGPVATVRHALAGLARVLAIEVAPHRVNVNVVGSDVDVDSPGAGSEAIATLTRTVLWLACDASRFVTGSIVRAGHDAAVLRTS